MRTNVVLDESLSSASPFVIEAQLYSRIEQAADEQKIGIERILTDALRRYLWELDRRKISAESQVYRRRHAELKAQYQGRYIAMHGGQVVDHDSDVTALRERVRQRFGRRPVMITLVEAVAEPPLIRRGFHQKIAKPCSTLTTPFTSRLYPPRWLCCAIAKKDCAPSRCKLCSIPARTVRSFRSLILKKSWRRR
jgi:hypothetical protein